VVVAVAESTAKGTLFDADERCDMIRTSVKGMRRVEVVHFSDLVVQCARRVGAQVMIRGLRAVSDFEFEFQMALMNRRLASGIEVAFLMPSQQYTYLNSTLVKEIARLGVETTVLTTRRSSMAGQLKIIKQARLHDVVLLFKTLGFSPLELALLQRANPRIIFDFDDAVMFREQKHRKPLSGKNFRKFLRTVGHCSAVVAGNDFLACFAQACRKRTVVLPTSIDLAKYHLKQHREGLGLTIGWLGLSDGLPYLRHIRTALQRLTKRFPGLRLKVISDKPLYLDGVTVENEPWRLETEQANLSSFDIGIMPLWDSVWTRGKCGYKILQYMGVGTAVVASDVGVNSEIITSGENGFLARTEDDWVNAIASLIENAAQRKSFGLRGRELVEARYSLDAFTRGYVKLLREVTHSPGEQVRTASGNHTLRRWNISSRARELSGGDAIVIS
jgi:pantetheine-phosphate adenylyltransferase